MTQDLFRDPYTGSIIYVQPGAHELVADDNGEPSCSCGHKPVPLEGNNRTDVLRLISEHAKEKREEIRSKTIPVIHLKDLPVGTVIKDEEHGNYEIANFGNGDFRIWMEVYPHCVDCTTFVAEDKMPEKDMGTGTVIETKANEYFQNWLVTLVPPLIGADLLDQINKFNEAKIAHPRNR